MAKTAYAKYLESDHWRELRTKKRAKTNRCGICAATEQLDTHHLIYRDLVSVETSDLRVLCRRCHFLAHDLMKQGLLRFPSENTNSRWTLLKTAVKKSLGLTGKNMF